MLRILALLICTGLPLFAAAADDDASPEMSLGQEDGVKGDLDGDGVPELSDGASVVDCYDNAVARLEAICDDYRRIKAIQLSRQRDIAFDDAYENISSVMPILKPIERKLLTKPVYDPEDVVPHKRAVEKVESEVQMMVELAAKLLEEIEKVQAEMQQQHARQEQQEITLKEIVEQEQYDPEQVEEMQEEMQEQQNEDMQQLEELAREDEQERAKDLVEQMRKIQPVPDIKDLTEEEEERVKEMDLAIMKGSSDVRNNMKEMTVDQLNRCMGRRVELDDGAAVEWMFVDTWYTIGPFPNPSRVNLHKKFPPETVVDLSAEYEGKRGESITWEFLQMGEARCVPNRDEEYAIYYAYTELWFDQPMDLWIAVGSDDKASVWVNDLPVWISGDQLKGWKVNEGFRKVSFQPGVNRILYRIENGWIATAFSLGIKVAP